MELGYRGSGEVLKREEFELRKQAAAASKQARRDQERYDDSQHLLVSKISVKARPFTGVEIVWQSVHINLDIARVVFHSQHARCGVLSFNDSLALKFV